jgi:23S rRNA (cytidine1920-2'-O)/16S rRNA (cytidine1409-2'-O)-methyltransferase
MMEKERLDQLLVRRGLAPSRAQAQRLIMAGQVSIAGQVCDRPGRMVATDAPLALAARPRFVSRGGEKLAAALARFAVDVRGWVAADVGASTGGFTDCLLQHGAARVYAIDVGYGQLDWRLRNDPRVVVMERTNARYLERLAEPVDLVVADVSFISLGLILRAAVGWLKPEGQVLALVKPQFEAGRRQVARGGVVRDPAVHSAVLHQVVDMAANLGLALRGLMASPLRGPAGNVEFLGWWQRGGEPLPSEATILGCLKEVEKR